MPHASNSDLKDGCTLVVSGGNFTDSHFVLDSSAQGASVAVTGGTHSVVPPAGFVPEGNAAIASSDGSFMIVPADSAANGSVAKTEVNGVEVFFPSKEAADAFVANQGVGQEGITVSYKVIFDYMIDGEDNVETDVEAGKLLSKPETDPVREGYTFGGWFTEDAFVNAYDFNKPVDGPVTLFAKWTKNESTNGGGTSGTDKPVVDKPNIDKPAVDKPVAKKPAVDTLAKTGDPLPVMPLLVLCGVTALIALGAFAKRLKA